MVKRARWMLVWVVLVLGRSVAAQDKPTIMVMPSEKLMKERQFCRVVQIDGQPADDCDLQRFLTTDNDFASIVTNVQIAFQDRGFPIANLLETMKGLAEERQLQMTSTRAIAQTGQDMLLSAAKPDIAIYVETRTTEEMGEKRVQVVLDARDVYTATSVASADRTSQPSPRFTSPELAKAVIVGMMPEFESRLLDHFRRLASSGRQIRLRFNVLESAELEDGVNSDVTVGDEEIVLRAYISKLVRGKALNGQVQPGRSGPSFVNFNSVNIAFGQDPEEFLSDVSQQFRRDTGLRARVASGRGPGDLVLNIDAPAARR